MRAAMAVSMLLAPTLALAGWNSVKGDGKLKTETRDVRGFTQVEIGVPVDLVLRQGEFAVKVTVDSNLQAHVKTRLEGNALTIRSEESLDPNQKARIEVTLPDLQLLAIQGSSDAEVHGFTNAKSMKVEINGSGDVDYQGSPAKLSVDINGSGDVNGVLGRELSQVEVQVNGSGDVQLAGARTAKLAIEVHGSGNVNARRLPANEGAYSVSGSGSIRTALTGGEARFEIDGSGDIEWSGEADVRAKIIEGSGEVRRIRE